MSNLENLIWEDDRESIYDSIERTLENIDTILLWQLTNDGTRIKEKALIQKFNFETGTLLLSTIDEKSNVFIKQNELFLKFEDRSLLFKTKIEKLGEGKLQVKLPKNYRILENRNQKRRKIPKDVLKLKIEKSDTEIIGKTSFELIVLDLCEKGVGLLFSVTKLNSFCIGEKVYLKKFGNTEVRTPLLCRIVHLTEYDKTKTTMIKRDYKMGLEFLDGIPEIIEKELAK